MTPFGLDPQPLYANVTSVASPLGGAVGFSIPMSHYRIGQGWATWSHGYTGDVYYTNGPTAVTLSMPSATGAFYLYAEPNPFAWRTITATTDAGTTVTQSVYGGSGAAYYGFYTTAGESIATIAVASQTTDFAVGEFGIANAAPIPEPGTLLLLGSGLAGLAGYGKLRFRRRKKE